MRFLQVSRALALVGVSASALTGCLGGGGDRASLPPARFVASKEQPGEEYVIGPLDQLSIFVWRNPELSAKVQVRPDGRITTPLVSDMPAVGKTPAMLADDMKIALSTYIKDPIVSVIVEIGAEHVQPADPHRRRDRKAGVAAVPRQHDAARRDDRGRRAQPISPRATARG